ncbi:TPA: hypothetical protein ACXE50_004399 [Klebsiella aerogenes]
MLFHTGMPDSQLVVDVFYQHGILIRPGEGFGLPGCPQRLVCLELPA